MRVVYLYCYRYYSADYAGICWIGFNSRFPKTYALRTRVFGGQDTLPEQYDQRGLCSEPD